MTGFSGFRKLFVLGLLSFAGGSALADGRIIRPDPAYFSQISAFSADWCGVKLCYGSVKFRQVVSVRAILVKAKGGTATGALYVEDDFRGVELLKPVFGVIGPVNANSGLVVETGRAAVTIDTRGEVDSVRLQTAAFGTIEEPRAR